MTLSGDFDLSLPGPSLPNGMVYTAGQQVRILHSGAIGRIFLKLPLRDVYLVQFPGFPVVEKIYNSCDIEALPASASVTAAEESLQHV